MADWVANLIEQFGYLGIFLLMFLETVFPPLPSEVILPLAGLQAERGRFSLPWVIAVGTAGAMAGNTVWYVAARALGMDRLRPLVARFGRWMTLDWQEVERAEDWFRRWGAAFVLCGRMVPTARSLVSIPAGLLGMKALPFLFWSTIGTAGWTGVLALAGWWLGHRFGEVEAWIGPVANGVIVALVGWYLWRVATWRRAKD